MLRKPNRWRQINDKHAFIKQHKPPGRPVAAAEPGRDGHGHLRPCPQKLGGFRQHYLRPSLRDLDLRFVGPPTNRYGLRRAPAAAAILQSK